MNLYEAILHAAQMRRRARELENAVGREKRRESFLASIPRSSETDLDQLHDLVDFQSADVR